MSQRLNHEASAQQNSALALPQEKEAAPRFELGDLMVISVLGAMDSGY
jgi:hypothetical protein